MKTSLLLIVLAAVFTVAFADGVNELEEKADMINYCKLLMKNGHLNGIVENEEDLDNKTLEQLYDIAIEGNRAAIRKNPKAANLRGTYIKHLEDEKAKLLKAKPETERKPESEPQPEPQSNQEQEQDQEPRINLDVESSSEATNEKPEDKTKLSFTQKVVKFVKGFF